MPECRVETQRKCYIKSELKLKVMFHPLFEADQNIICAGRDPEASDLAGVDVIFSAQENDAPPLLLEINYFLGRKGLGGSEDY